jgi:protein-tyrosine phosphatase
MTMPMPQAPCAKGAPVLTGVVKNARDLGGQLAGGTFTRCGALFRSAAPGLLDGAGCASVRALGVVTVIDLREGGEQATTPSASCLQPIVSASLPIPYSLSATDYLADLRSDASVRAVLETVASSDGGVLFHCTYGRDRSGVVSALLLRLAGVSRDDVLTEYQLTQLAGFGTSPDSLVAVLDELDAAGGAQPWLEARGVPHALVEAVRVKLLVP